MHFRRLLPIALSALTTSAIHAQFSGSIGGTVQDPSGAAVPGALVTLTNTATAVVQTVRTDERGNYLFVGLGPATYTVGVDATGFGSSKRTAALEARQTQNLPITLALASNQTTVDVSTAAPLLD